MLVLVPAVLVLGLELLVGLVILIRELLASKILVLEVVIPVPAMLVLGLKELVALVLSSVWEYTRDHLKS